MKSKILTILLILLSILCLFSCGGDDNDDSKKDYKIVTFIYGENNSKSDQICFYEDGSQSRELNYSTAIFGYNLIGFFTEDGTQYFGSDAKKLNDIIIDRDLTVYAKYEPKNYKFIFDAQSGMLDDGLSKKEVFADYGTDLNTVFLAPTNANPKFEFDGWFNEDGSVRYSYGTELVSDGPRWGNGFGADLEITLYAKFKVRELTVTLDFNDGVTPTEEIKVEYGQPVGDLSVYYKDNGTQDIASWSSISYGEMDLPSAITEDIRIYAVWKEYKNVVFVYGVGDERTIKVHQTPGESSTLPLQNNPGYNFEGWYTTSIFSGNPVENIPYGAVADKYYGKWSVADYTLSFDAGTGEVIDSVIYHYKDTTELPSPVREGYTFSGWYYDKAENSFFKIPSSLWGDKQLYAKWVANEYMVSLDTDGGTIEASKNKLTYGSAYTLEVPTKYGHTFLGWYNGDLAYTNEKGESLESFKGLSDITLTAKYKVSVYEITYIVDGREFAKESYEHGSRLEFPKAPTKENLFFGGWYNEDLTIEYTESNVALENITYYASFVESIAIESPEDLNKIRENPSAKYHLTKDINLLGESWTPIDELTGTFDGNGHKIFNFNISVNVSSSSKIGLFRVNSGVIKNLVISDAVLSCVTSSKVSGNVGTSSGFLVGSNKGSIINCEIVSSSIKSTGLLQPTADKGTAELWNELGSIAGENIDNGIIDSCKSNATITATLEQNQINYDGGRRPTGRGALLVAGIVGINEKSTSIISNCKYTGQITITGSFTGTSNGGYLYGYNHLGGITSQNYGKITECYVDAMLLATSNDSCGHNTWDWDTDTYSSVILGGISTSNYGEITKSVTKGSYEGACNAGKQTGSYTKLIRIGGVVAVNESNTSLVSDCYSNANVVMHAGNDRDTGGLVGANSGKIKNSYCTGNVTSTTGTAGGFVGTNLSTGTIMNSFSLGNVAFTTADGTKGIFVGNNKGMLNGCAFATEAQLTSGGSAVSIPMVAGLTSMPKSDILNWEFIFNTLYWENTIWVSNSDTPPVLFNNKLYEISQAPLE